MIMPAKSVRYEIVVIYSLAKGEDAAVALKEKFEGMIRENGAVESVDVWGRRRLAYLINDENEGYYVLCNFSADPDFPAELSRVLGITDGVLRSLIIKKDGDAPEEVPEEAPEEVSEEAPEEEPKEE